MQVINNSGNFEIGLRFEQYCGACPEGYNVYCIQTGDYLGTMRIEDDCFMVDNPEMEPYKFSNHVEQYGSREDVTARFYQILQHFAKRTKKQFGRQEFLKDMRGFGEGKEKT